MLLCKWPLKLGDKIDKRLPSSSLSIRRKSVHLWSAVLWSNNTIICPKGIFFFNYSHFLFSFSRQNKTLHFTEVLYQAACVRHNYALITGTYPINNTNKKLTPPVSPSGFYTISSINGMYQGSVQGSYWQNSAESFRQSLNNLLGYLKGLY